ncbi:MAG: hypothetical protein Q4A41_04995 [Bacillota bacterium]|nr:hypothetical protein [Bacillota bacterium]
MFEKIKDILFDIRDFIIVIAIISVLVFSVTWKIGETLDVDIDNKVVVNIESTVPPTQPTTVPPTTPVPTGTTEVSTTTTTTTTTKSSVIRFQVREGEFGQDIAANLLSLGLIESTDAFLVKAHEMGVDTSLRTGVYELRTDDDLETILKLLSGGSRE